MTATKERPHLTPPKSAQEAQWDQLENEIVALIEHVAGQQLGALDAQTQEKIAGHIKDIQQVKADVEGVRKAYADRFQELAARHNASGGRWSGHFASAAEAKRVGQFCAAVMRGDEAKAAELNKASISGSSGESGGFLAAETLYQEVIRLVEKYGVFAAHTIVRPQPSQGARIPKRTGGLSVSYPDIDGAPTVSEMTFGAVKPNLTTYAAYALVDRSMLQDELAVPLANLIVEELAYAMAYAEDLNAFMGDGSPTYARVSGLFKTAGGADVTGVSGDDTFLELIAKSSVYLMQVAGSLPEWADDGDLAWYGHRSILFGYYGLRDTQDRPLVNIFINELGRAEKTLAMYPYRTTHVAPALSQTAVSTAMLVLANLRRGRSLARHTVGAEFRQSEHVKFLENQIAMVMQTRQDIVAVDNNAHGRLITAAS